MWERQECKVGLWLHSLPNAPRSFWHFHCSLCCLHDSSAIHTWPAMSAGGFAPSQQECCHVAPQSRTAQTTWLACDPGAHCRDESLHASSSKDALQQQPLPAALRRGHSHTGAAAVLSTAATADCWRHGGSLRMSLFVGCHIQKIGPANATHWSCHVLVLNAATISLIVSGERSARDRITCPV
jgi:hypothetical protein